MASADKYDVFVGNLTFNTTEDQLREKFMFVGPVKSIRLLADKDTGKPKGFAFVEYFDSNTALSAIKHLDQTELNGRKIKVGYPAQSNLKVIARQIGQLVPESSADAGAASVSAEEAAHSRAQIEQNIISNMKLHEAWDALDAFKKLVADDPRGQKVKGILETHPQLIGALCEIQKRLGLQLPASFQQQQQQQQPSQGTKRSYGSVSSSGASGGGTTSGVAAQTRAIRASPPPPPNFNATSGSDYYETYGAGGTEAQRASRFSSVSAAPTSTPAPLVAPTLFDVDSNAIQQQMEAFQAASHQ